VVGPFFFHLPPVVVGVLVSGGVGGMVAVIIGICIGILMFGEGGMVEGPSQVDVDTILGFPAPYWEG
jgi:hypothetical protein